MKWLLTMSCDKVAAQFEKAAEEGNIIVEL